MKTKLPYLLICVVAVLLTSCGNPAFRGFKTMPDGTMMRFYRIDDMAQQPKVGDIVSVEINQYYGDSLGFSTNREYGRPMRYEVYEPAFTGDIMAALLNMHVNDSVTVVFVIDSLCIKTYGMDKVPEYFTPGMPVYADIHLVDIISTEQLEKERREELNERKQNDAAMLLEYQNDKDYIVTDDGLVVLNITGKSGKKGVEGDIMMIRFLLQTLDGDTLVDLYGEEPVAVRCGDQELGIGFDKALRMMEKGGTGSFVIPSSLAFDSLGLDESIPPYASLKLDVEVLDIMTINQFEEFQTEKKRIENEEAQKRLASEPERIATFVKEHNVMVEPTESGIYFLEIVRGDGMSAEKGDIVSIHYNIYNTDDKLIETSYDGVPMKFVYGSGEMVPGIEEAIGYMKVGGKATIIVPSKMAFGEYAIDNDLPAYSTVIFDIDFVDLEKKK